MTWNYRIVKHETQGGWYGLHQVYYNKKNEITHLTEKSVIACDADEGPDGIIGSLKLMLDSLNKYPEVVEREKLFMENGEATSAVIEQAEAYATTVKPRSDMGMPSIDFEAGFMQAQKVVADLQVDNERLRKLLADYNAAGQAIVDWVDELGPFAEDGSEPLPIFEVLRAIIVRQGDKDHELHAQAGERHSLPEQL